MAAQGGGGLKGFYGLLAAVGVAGVVLIGWLAFRPKAAPVAVDVAVLPADTAGFRGYVLGAESAPVEVVEYADFQCPACQSFATIQFPDIKARLIDTGKLRWRYRDFPLPMHPHARVAAHSAACAFEQGKYWEQHARIYDGQMDWSVERDASGTFRDYAKEVGLDLGKYDDCMSANRFAGRVQASVNEATTLGVGSTPTFLIAGKLYPGIINSDQMRTIVDSLAALATGAATP